MAKQGKVVKSYGIICCRYVNQRYEILMVKKIMTYCFAEFIHGHYNSTKKSHHLERLFNGMTYYEKRVIMSMNFDHISQYPCRNVFTKPYYVESSKKAKFDKSFDNAKIYGLIKNSKNSEVPWEFPRGRKFASELPINTAIREFNEETGYTNYSILWSLKPYVETYMDFGITYQNIYYFAISNDNVYDPYVDMSSAKQSSEISDIRWIGKADIQYLHIDKIAHYRLITLFDKIIKKIKNHTKRI